MRSFAGSKAPDPVAWPWNVTSSVCPPWLTVPCRAPMVLMDTLPRPEDEHLDGPRSQVDGRSRGVAQRHPNRVPGIHVRAQHQTAEGEAERAQHEVPERGASDSDRGRDGLTRWHRARVPGRGLGLRGRAVEPEGGDVDLVPL